MLEIEIKLPITDPMNIETQLIGLGFELYAHINESDIYFDNDAGQIRYAGQALRVREVRDVVTNETKAMITFKGARLEQQTMSRKELETNVSEASVCIQILEELGFHQVLPYVKKDRREYVRGRMTACLDDVEGLGDFLELEIMIENQEEKEAALNEINKVLQCLGYSIDDTVTRSYLGMLLTKEA